MAKKRSKSLFYRSTYETAALKGTGRNEFALMRLRDGAMLAYHPTRGPLEKLADYFSLYGCRCAVRQRSGNGVYWRVGESYAEFLAHQRKYYAKRKGENATTQELN